MPVALAEPMLLTRAPFPMPVRRLSVAGVTAAIAGFALALVAARLPPLTSPTAIEDWLYPVPHRFLESGFEFGRFEKSQ